MINADKDKYMGFHSKWAGKSLCDMSSVQPTKSCWKPPAWGHGVFARTLIDGLNGEAADRKGVVKLVHLYDYVRETVMKLTENAQEPAIPEFTFSGEFLKLKLAVIK